MNYSWLHSLFQIAVAFSVGFGKQQRTTPWTGRASDAVQNLIPNVIVLIVDYVLKRLTLQWKDETERPQVLLSEIVAYLNLGRSKHYFWRILAAS